MNESQNRYIDPETGKLLDSAQSEVVGAIGGGLLGSMAINALGQYNTYKEGLGAQEQIPGLIADTEAMLEKDRLDLELVDLAHKYREDPSVLDQFHPDSREIIRQDIDLLERIHGREKWDRINELPFKERAEMFIKSQKPSYDGYPHRVVEEMKGIYGPRPMHPEVPVVLREEIAAKSKDIEDFKAMLDEPVKFDWKKAAPSLDHYKPKNLLGTVMNPYVATGLFAGAMGGKAYDEYNKHKALIAQREALNEKTAALKLPKLKMPKPKTPDNAPLIPKKVKRIGTLGLGAGVLGYTGVKATQQFQAGSDLAERVKSEGMAAKTPAQLEKERNNQTKVANDITFEGTDQHMKTAYEKYQELEKIAGARDALQQGIGHLTGGNVNFHQGALEDAIALGDHEGIQQLLQGRVDDAVKSRNIARGVAGAAAGTGAAGAGVAVHQHSQEKSAFQKYEDLEKIALNLGGLGNAAKGVKESAKNFGGTVKKTLHDASGKDVKKWEATRERAMESGMGAKGLQATDKRLAQASADQAKARKQVGIAAGGLAAGGAGAAIAGKAIHDRNQEKTAAVTEEEGKQSVIPTGTKIGAGIGAATMAPLWGIIGSADGMGSAVAHGVGGGVAGAVNGALLGTGAELMIRGTKALKEKESNEKTALEKYEALAKEAGIGNAVKKGVNHLTGKNVKFHQGMVDDSIKLGDNVGTIQMLQKNVEGAKKARNIARGVAGGTVGAAAAGTAGGMMAAKSNGQEKVAKEVAQEDSQYALDHPFTKTIKDGAEIGAKIGAPLGAIGGGIAGLEFGGSKMKGIPAALAGAAAGTIGGGLTGALSGASATPLLAAERQYVNDKLHEGGSGASAGALAGGLIGGGVSALSAPATATMTGSVLPAIAGIATGALTGAGVGSLVGKNQEKHYNNVHNGEFETSKVLERRQARQPQAGLEQTAEVESDAIDKAASEVINELFKEASAVIADDSMEKVASIQSPISKINGSMFGYDRLK